MNAEQVQDAIEKANLLVSEYGYFYVGDFDNKKVTLTTNHVALAEGVWSYMQEKLAGGDINWQLEYSDDASTIALRDFVRIVGRAK